MKVWRVISDSLKSPNDDEDYQEGSGDATTEPQKVYAYQN